jgi:hypothetical protein
VDDVVDTVAVAVQELLGVQLAGLKEHAAPAGRFEHDSVTADAVPAVFVTVAVDVVLEPLVTVAELAAIVKANAVGAVTENDPMYL